MLLTLNKFVLPTRAFNNAPSKAVSAVFPSDEAAVTKYFLGDGNIKNTPPDKFFIIFIDNSLIIYNALLKINKIIKKPSCSLSSPGLYIINKLIDRLPAHLLPGQDNIE